MVYNRLYIDLANYIDLKVFDSLHPVICRGIATASHLAFNGLQTINPGSINPNTQNYKITPLYEAHETWSSLPPDSLLKKAGEDLDYNQLTTYLKFAFGGYDLYSIYRILDAGFQETGLGEMEQHFPSLIEWILNFKDQGIFKSLHSATLMVIESGGIPWEHCDPEQPEDVEEGFIPEFIHIKTDLDRPFYMIDPETKNKVYVNTRVAWWNERDWHGGEPISRPSYTLRINGRFSDEFKQRLESNNAL